mgnify:CR=1 FL=1|jgi:MSHA biogenesis protein MshM
MEEVLNHFGLRVNPFSITPNTDLYCKLPYQQEALQTIKFSLAEGNSIVIVSGEVGTGKTILCRKLMLSLDENYKVAFIPHPKMSVKALLKSIARDLGIENTEEHDVYEAINQRLIQNAEMGKKTVLIIDEAQNLSTDGLETIRLLTNLETETQKLIQIILFAQPELMARLEQAEMRQFMQRVMSVCQLDVLSFELLKDYMSGRLVKAGHESGRLLEDATLKGIWKASSGVPRVVNILAYKAMMSAYVRDAATISVVDVNRAIKESYSQLSSLTSNAQSQTQGWFQRDNLFTYGMLALSGCVMLTSVFLFIGDWLK